MIMVLYRRDRTWSARSHGRLFHTGTITISRARAYFKPNYAAIYFGNNISLTTGAYLCCTNHLFIEIKYYVSELDGRHYMSN